MTNPPHVYSTSDPATVDAFRQAAMDYKQFARRLNADAATIGKNAGPVGFAGLLGEGRVTGLNPDDPADPPTGWRYLKGRKVLAPVRGKAGDEARRWLADHQPPRDVRDVMVEHGLPRNDDLRGGAGAGRVGVPHIFLHDGVVWAAYRGAPDGSWTGGSDQCNWERRKLSEFHAALEAFETAHAEKVSA